MRQVYQCLKWITLGRLGRGKYCQDILQSGRKIKIWRGGPGSGC